MENRKKTWFVGCLIGLVILALLASAVPAPMPIKAPPGTLVRVTITAFYRDVCWAEYEDGTRYMAAVTECKVTGPHKGLPKILTIYHDQSQRIAPAWQTVGNRGTFYIEPADLKHKIIYRTAVMRAHWEQGNLPR